MNAGTKILNKRFAFILLALALSLAITTPTAWAGDEALRQHIASAREYAQDGQWNYAGFEWREALAINPQSLEANIGLTETLLQAGYVQDAVRHAEEARNHLDKLQLELVYGQALEQAGEYEKAEKVYLRNLQRVPLEMTSFRRLVALQAQLPEDQRKILKGQLSQIADAASKNGRKALEARQFELAADNFAVSTLVFPSLEDLNDYGVILTLMGRYDDANRQFDLLHRTQTEKWEFYANSAFVSLGKGRTAEASGLLEKAIGLCSDPVKRASLYNNLGYIFESQGKWGRARNAYERAIEFTPGFNKAMLNLAYAYQKDMAYDRAIRTYQAVLKTEPANTNVWNRLGFVCELAHKEKQALSAYKRATRLNPNDREAYNNLAILYRKLGDTPAADREYKHMMEIEFRQIENGRNVPQISRGQSRDDKTRLLDYVDVFFSERTMVGQS